MSEREEIARQLKIAFVEHSMHHPVAKLNVEYLFPIMADAVLAMRGAAATPPTAWRVWWVSLNTARTELFEDIAKANAKARETGGCVIPLYAAAAATPPNRWRHKKRGTTYVLLGNAITQTEAPLSDMDPVLVYQSEKDGTLWVRPGHEFLDGRFEEISPVTRPNRGDAT